MIIGLQQQQTEVGRIRLGVKIKTEKGKERPAKLDRLRFTSPRKVLIDKIAELYGGTVEPWQPPRGSQQWQVITNTREVPVLIPPQDPAQGQWYEMWSAGGCQRRCDGQTETISKQPCMCLAEGCEPEDRDCKLHTRLRVMLEDVPGLGAWRVDTGSYYAAVELPGVAQLLAMAQGAIPGKLVLDQRTVTRGGQTKQFVVPVLHVEEITPRQLVSGRVQELIAERRAAAIETSPRPALAAGVDWVSLADAAQNVAALRDVYRQANEAGQLDDDLHAKLNARAGQLKAHETLAEPAIEGELIEVTT